MPVVTPDVEGHLIARIVALVGGTTYVPSGDAVNITPGPEQRPGGQIKVVHTFVRYYNERRAAFYGGALQRRELLCQILHRYARDGADAPTRAAAAARMRTLYDALQRSGTWIAAGPVQYDDIRIIDAPAELELGYFAMNVAVWYPG